jgi:hypothetical protein
MANTSATGGYLTPNYAITPTIDDDFIDTIQEMVCGVSGIDGHLMFPRWQLDPPAMPDYTVTWGALGVVERRAETYASTLHVSEGDGHDILIRQEDVDIMISFYGPSGATHALQLREGLQIKQNVEILYDHGIAFVETSDVASTAEYVNQRWMGRYDITLTVRRLIQLIYGIQNVLSAQGVVTTGDYQSPFDTDTLLEPVVNPLTDTAKEES